MNLVGVMPVRNEDWIIGLSVRAALMWCDSLVALNHASTDNSAAILEQIQDEHPQRLIVLHEPDETWEEMRHRQRMLEEARESGATHIALIDADEVLTGNLLPTIREHVERLHADAILNLPWLCLMGGISMVITSGQWGSANVSAAFKDDPAYHWKARDGYDFHHRHPMGRQTMPVSCPQLQTRTGGLMHLQFASWKRLCAKQALYQATERLRWPERDQKKMVEMYSNTVRQAASAQTMPVPREWWQPYARLMKHVKVNAEPWQEQELRNLIAEHGREKFADLNLFGIAGIGLAELG